MPSPYTAIPRDQAAEELHVSLDRLDAEAKRRGVRSFMFEGAVHFSAGDLERTWLEDESRHDEIPASSILPPEIKSGGEILFSTDAGGSSSSTASMADKLVPIAGAATRCGLTEDQMRERITFRCKLRVVNGELFARQGDLHELAEAGVIPKPSEVEAAAKRTAAATRPVGNAATEAKTASTAAALAIDIDRPEPTDAADQTPQQFQTVSASKRKRRRLGAPRRWGQR